MDNIENALWDIVCSKEQFNKLGSDDRFLGLLRLARSVNALRFCQKPAIDVQNKDTPSSDRQLINSFLFTSSVLSESFIVVEELGKHFHNFDSFKDGFGNLIREKNFQKLRNTIYKRIRNKFVFHFDKDVAAEALENFELKKYRFASGNGKNLEKYILVLRMK